MSSRDPTTDRTIYSLALGAWLRATREPAGWNQGELARRAGMSQPVLSRIEAGSRLPDAYTFGRLAAALGTDTEGLTAAIDRVIQAMLRGARGLMKEPRGSWSDLLPRLGYESTAALALAAARVWLPR